MSDISQWIGGGSAPAGPAGGSLQGTYPNPVLGPLFASAYIVAQNGADESAAFTAALANFAPFARPSLYLGPGLHVLTGDVLRIARNVGAQILGPGKKVCTVRLGGRVDAATVTGGSGTVLDASITAADAGTVVMGTGIPRKAYVGTVTPGVSFQLSSSPTSQVNLNAVGGATKVTIGAAQFAQPDKVADYDLFANIEMGGFTLDCNNIGGNHAVLFGSWANNGSADLNRLQFQDSFFHDIDVINLPATNALVSNTNGAILLNSTCLAGGETQQLVNSNLRFERITMSGGKSGIVCVANGVVSATQGLIPFYDRLTCEDCYWDSGIVPAAAPTGAWGGFDFIGNGIGGSLDVINCTSKNSNDVGMQIDGALDALVDNWRSVDCWNNGILLTSFQVPPNAPQLQKHVLRRARHTALNVIAGSGAFEALVENNNPLGDLVFDTCSSELKGITYGAGTTIWNLAIGANTTTLPCRSVRIKDFSVLMDGFTCTAASQVNAYFCSLSPTNITGRPAPVVSIEGLNECYVNGTLSAAGPFVFRGLCFNAGSCEVDGSGVVSYDYTLAGQTASTTTLCLVGLNAATVYGVLPRVLVTQFSGGDATPTALNVSANATISPHVLKAPDWDVKNLPAGASLITGPAANQPFTRADSWTTPTWPQAEATITVGASVFTYTNNDRFRQDVYLDASASTTCSVVKNGSSLQQFNGAGAAGNKTVFDLIAGDTLAVTYTGTAPVMKKQVRR